MEYLEAFMNKSHSFKLGYNTNSWGKTPNQDEMFNDIAKAGWKGVELISLSLDWLGTPNHLAKKLKNNGLVVASMFGRVDDINSDSNNMLEREKRRIEYGAEFEAEVYAFTGPQRPLNRKPTEDEFKRFAEQVQILIDHASGLGQVLAFHAHPASLIETEQEQDILVSYVPKLQICLDVSVSALMGEDPIAQLKKYSNRLGYVHLKDVDHGKFCVMGRGRGLIDFMQVKNSLIDIGYDGWVVGELGSGADTGAIESCNENLKYLRSLGY